MASYKIKELEALSGIKAHTIRIWEKRYDLLQPERSDSKIRSYDETQLKRLLNISVLYNNGWKISKIAALSDAEIRQNTDHIAEDHQTKNVIVTLFIESLLAYDHRKFERILDKSIEKEGFESVYRYYLLPFLKRIGVLWIVDTISPAQEHFISNLIRQKLIVAINNLPHSENENVDSLLLTPTGEFHEIALLYYHYALRKKGDNVMYLGVDVPIDSIVKTINVLQPKKVIISLVAGQSEKQVNHIIHSIRDNTNAHIYLGGAFIETIPLPKVDDLDYINKIITV
jgi:DNA-binding transcriptional MerR regulator/transcriptional regulator of met regulon